MNEINVENTDADARAIASDVVESQRQVCDARRDNLADKLATLADSVRANTTSIATLTTSMAMISSTVGPLPEKAENQRGEIDDLKEAVQKLKGRPGWAAAIGAAVGAGAPLLLEVILKQL